MAKKLEQQRKYKEDLDRQKEARMGLKWAGKMTQAERALNRQDLDAFKNYDGH